MKTPWPTKKLGEICKFQNGVWKSKKEPWKEIPIIRNINFLERGLINWQELEVIPIEEKFLKTHLLEEGDIILERSGGGPEQPVGRVAYFDKKEGIFTFSNFTTQIRIKDKNFLSPKFLWAFLHHLYLIGVTKSLQNQTTGIRNLDFKAYKNLEIPIPPLDLQQKIVYVLDSIKEGISAQEKIIEKTKELKRAMMADLFKYGGPSFRKGRKLKKTEIGEIPEDWKAIHLSDDRIFDIRTGLWTGKKPPLTKVKVIRNTNFEDGRLILKNVAEIDVEVKQLRERDLRRGDILLERSGGGPDQPVGRVVYINSDLPNFSFSNFTSRIRTMGEEKIFPAFVFRYLDYFYQKGGTLNLQERTTGIRNLRLSNYLKQGIPAPNIKEQKEIAEILQTIDQKIEIEQKKKALYEELFKTMLNKLMSGEIKIDNFSFEEK